MSASEAIKKRLSDLDITQIELAIRLDTTRQNISNKMKRDNFSAQELVQICNVLNLKMVLVDENKHEYVIEYLEETK